MHRCSPRLGLSLLEAKRGDSEEAEAVSAMASLSVANTNAMDQRYGDFTAPSSASCVSPHDGSHVCLFVDSERREETCQDVYLCFFPSGRRRNQWKRRNHCNGGNHKGVALLASTSLENASLSCEESRLIPSFSPLSPTHHVSHLDWRPLGQRRERGWAQPQSREPIRRQRTELIKHIRVAWRHTLRDTNFSVGLRP